MRTSLAALIITLLFARPALAQDTEATKQVEDAMLAPVPRAKTEIRTWEEATQHVRARSTDLRIALAEVSRAEGQQRIALGGVLPSITGSVGYTHNLITNDTLQFGESTDASGAPVTTPVKVPFPDYLNGQVVFTQPAVAFRAWNAIGTAKYARRAAELSYDDAKRRISLAVANAMVGVITAERIAELNRLGLRNAVVRRELTLRRTTLGGGTSLDVARSRQDVVAARATLVAGDEALRQAREALGLALGLPEQVGVPPNVDITGFEKDARAMCKAVPTVDDRPDVLALRAQTDAAHRRVRDVTYQYVPTVDLQSVASTTTIDTGAAPNTTWSVGALLTIPLWEGGVRYGNSRVAEAQETIALQNLEAGRRQAAIQVIQARRGVTVAAERRQVALEGRDQAAETDRLTRLAYQDGRGTSLELVSAAQALREGEIELALREFELVRTRILAVLALASCPW
jgi:outer membrane protein TolC